MRASSLAAAGGRRATRCSPARRVAERSHPSLLPRSKPSPAASTSSTASSTPARPRRARVQTRPVERGMAGTSSPLPSTSRRPAPRAAWTRWRRRRPRKKGERRGARRRRHPRRRPTSPSAAPCSPALPRPRPPTLPAPAFTYRPRRTRCRRRPRRCSRRGPRSRRRRRRPPRRRPTRPPATPCADCCASGDGAGVDRARPVFSRRARHQALPQQPFPPHPHPLLAPTTRGRLGFCRASRAGRRGDDVAPTPVFLSTPLYASPRPPTAPLFRRLLKTLPTRRRPRGGGRCRAESPARAAVGRPATL